MSIQELGRDPVDILRFPRHIALRIDEAVKLSARRNAIDHFDAADFDQAMTASWDQGPSFRYRVRFRAFSPFLLEPGDHSRQNLLVGRGAERQELSDDSVDLTVAVFDRSARVHNEIGARLLFVLWKLPRNHGLELRIRHSGARENPLALNFGRRRNDDDGIDVLVAPTLKEERNFKNRHRGAVRVLLVLQETPLGVMHARMHDGFEILEAVWSPR